MLDNVLGSTSPTRQSRRGIEIDIDIYYKNNIIVLL